MHQKIKIIVSLPINILKRHKKIKDFMQQKIRDMGAKTDILGILESIYFFGCGVTSIIWSLCPASQSVGWLACCLFE